MASKSDDKGILLGCLFVAGIMLLPILLFTAPGLVLVIALIAIVVIAGQSDSNNSNNKSNKKVYAIPEVNASIIGLIAIMMKANGQATKSELNEVKIYLLEKYGEQKAKKLLLLLREKLKKEVHNIRPYCLQINRNLTYTQKLDFFTLLFRIAEANDGICSYEKEILSQIARHIVIRNSDFVALTEQFATFYGHSKKQAPKGSNEPGWAHKVLMIEPSATQEEIRKAYRRLVMLHHPDRVDQNDNEKQKAAAAKFREINSAYLNLKKDS